MATDPLLWSVLGMIATVFGVLAFVAFLAWINRPTP